ALNAGRAARIAVYSENLDLVRCSGPRYEEILKTYLREKYRDRPIGVIATIGPAALSFMLRARPELWPDVSAIFASVDPETAAQAQIPQLLRQCRRCRLRRHCSSLAVAPRRRLFWAHSQSRSHLPAYVDHRREHNDDLVRPNARVVAKVAPQGAIIRFIKHQSALVIGEPNDELPLFPVIADHFHSHGFDPKLLRSFQILSPEVFGLIEIRRKENHVPLLFSWVALVCPVVSRQRDDALLSFAVALAGPSLGRDRQIERPGRLARHPVGELFRVAEAFWHLGNNLVVNVENDGIACSFNPQHCLCEKITGYAGDDVLSP